MRTEEDVKRAIDQYADMVKKICFVHMKNHTDTEDIFQEVFLKYALFSGPFDSEEHKKSWLIRVTVNQCKDLLKSFFKKRTVYIEDVKEYIHEEVSGSSEVLEAVLGLPENYRMVIYLFYYEGYSAVDIGRILRKNENTIYTHLSRARAELKKQLGGDVLGESDTKRI